MAEIPATMLAWQKHRGDKKLVRVELPIPQCPDNGLIVKILAAGVCHTDCSILAKFDDAWPPWWGEKFTLGHEGAGEIVQIGKNVPHDAFKVGQRIALLNCAGCQSPSCPECSRNLHQVCNRGQTFGLGQDGCFAPYLVMRGTNEAISMPEGVTPAQAAIAIDAVMTAFHTVTHPTKADVTKGQDSTVVVFGLGGLGLNALQTLLWLKPKRIIAVERKQELIDAAIKLGLPREDAICNKENPTAIDEYVQKNEILVDKVIDYVGINETFASAANIIRYGGSITLVGANEIGLTFPNVPLLMKNISVRCSYGGTQADLEKCLELIAEGVLKPMLQTDTLENLPKIIEGLDEGRFAGRVVLIPEGVKASDN